MEEVMTYSNEATSLDKISNDGLMMEMLKRLNDASKKQSESIRVIETKVDDTISDVSNLKESMMVLGYQRYRKQCLMFRSVCKARVKLTLGGDASTPQYVTFSPYFYKRIYKDIADELGVADYTEISMRDFADPNSQFNKALECARSWTPSKWYVDRCIGELNDKRDNGFLPPHRCRALTQYYGISENGCKNIFK